MNWLDPTVEERTRLVRVAYIVGQERCYCGAREQPMPRSMVTPEGVTSWQAGRFAATRVGGGGGSCGTAGGVYATVGLA